MCSTQVQRFCGPQVCSGRICGKAEARVPGKEQVRGNWEDHVGLIVHYQDFGFYLQGQSAQNSIMNWLRYKYDPSVCSIVKSWQWSKDGSRENSQRLLQ